MYNLIGVLIKNNFSQSRLCYGIRNAEKKYALRGSKRGTIRFVRMGLGIEAIVVLCWVWWIGPIIPVLGRWRQEDPEFEASLVWPCLNPPPN
jgi:hypothetical protein